MRQEGRWQYLVKRVAAPRADNEYGGPEGAAQRSGEKRYSPKGCPLSDYDEQARALLRSCAPSRSAAEALPPIRGLAARDASCGAPRPAGLPARRRHHVLARPAPCARTFYL